MRHPHHGRSSFSHHRHRLDDDDDRQTVIALSLPPFVRLGCLIVAVASLSFSSFVYVTSPSPPPVVGTDGLPPARVSSQALGIHQGNDSRLSRLRQRLTQTGGRSGDTHRLAIIIPFIGQGPAAIPSYLELFCTAAAGSANLVDFLLIHDGVLDGYHAAEGRPCPANVVFISLQTIEGFSYALTRVMDRKEEADIAVGGSRDALARVLARHILKYPYVMVEFKPALGHIFEEYLAGYSHWGYSDLDILFGDLEQWITVDELTYFDVVTYGFGDQDRVYLRGQFTFHRNDPHRVNQLWRACDYLSGMDQRFADVLSGEKHLQFESAEGCYSAAVLESTDLKVKYAVKAFTDVAGGKDTSYTHGLYVSTGRNRDRTVLYKAGGDDPRGLAAVPANWFEARGSVYADRRTVLYRDVGERERLPAVERDDVKCMFWAQKRYQSRLCLDKTLVNSTDTVFWIDGQLYKQKYELASLPGNIVTAPFFHFQEWKRYYRNGQLGGFHREGPAHTFVLAKEGVLPILPEPLVNAKPSRDIVPSPLGRTPLGWHGVRGDERDQLPHRYYCLRSVPKTTPPTTLCKFLASWRDPAIVEILSGAPAWTQLDVGSEVTLALTLQIYPEQLEDPGAIQGFLNLLTLYLDRWQGQPSVIVLHVAGATPDVADLLRKKFATGSDLSYYGLDKCLVAAIFSQKSDVLSRKALLNMATDAAPTRWVVAGYELERGVVMSQDTAYLAHRAVRIQKDSPGSVYVIPQFGLVSGGHDFTVPGLELSHLEGKLTTLAKLEVGDCEGDDASQQGDETGVFGSIESLWWQLTQRLTKDISEVKVDENEIEKVALRLEEIQLSLSSLLTKKDHYRLYATDISPILLYDNLGPRSGMVTSEMMREVEEFGGKLCYNSLRLAQMATIGYHVNVLAGAFAVSTPATRHVIGDPSKGALGVSRCDGCFFFAEQEHEDILESISLDERKRPAKIAILWESSADPLHGHTR